MGSIYESELDKNRYDKLAEHAGHDVRIELYDSEHEVALVCEDCGIILANAFSDDPNE
jgi:imidazoleglycerol phosphate dehydratase HisB